MSKDQIYDTLASSRSKRAAVIFLITFISVVATTFVGRLFGVEISRSAPSPICGTYPWTVTSGAWQAYGGLTVFSSQKASASGLQISNQKIEEGTIETTIRLPSYRSGCKAQIAYALHADRKIFSTAGIGGEGAAFSLGRYSAATGWRQLYKKGGTEAISSSSFYKLRLSMIAGRAVLEVNDRKVFESVLEKGAVPAEFGMWVDGCETAEFICTRFCGN